MVKPPTCNGWVASKRRAIDVTTPVSIAVAMVIGLKVDPNSYTLCVTLLRSASLLVPAILLGL